MSGYLCIGECQHYIEQDIYIIKLKKEVEELKRHLAEKDKVVQVLAEQVFKYAKWFGIKFEGGEVSEKYIIERATKQAEQ